MTARPKSVRAWALIDKDGDIKISQMWNSKEFAEHYRNSVFKSAKVICVQITELRERGGKCQEK